MSGKFTCARSPRRMRAWRYPRKRLSLGRAPSSYGVRSGARPALAAPTAQAGARSAWLMRTTSRSP
eukprot:3801337-Alexandrium_andersonii.AAC.1